MKSIARPSISNPQQPMELLSSKGFTLIEMLVVISLIVMIFVLAMPNISSSFRLSLSSTARGMASVITEAYNASVITGKVYRVAFDLKKNTYWIEQGGTQVLLDTKESKDKEEARRKFMKPGETAPPSGFTMDTTITRKKQSLPTGVTYEDVMNELSKDPIIEGIAYSHFFPHGLTEQTIIHIQDTSQHHASLVITSVIGQTDVYDRYISKKEAFDQ